MLLGKDMSTVLRAYLAELMMSGVSSAPHGLRVCSSTSTVFQTMLPFERRLFSTPVVRPHQDRVNRTTVLSP